MVSAPDPTPEHDLFREYRATGSRALRNRLVEQNMGLAAHIAKRYANREPGDDIRQVAMLGLVRAVERFDPDHGAAFGSFAGLTIEGEIKRHFRDRTWTVRVPRSAKDLHVAVRNGSDQLSQRLGRSPTVDELASELSLTRDDVVRGLAAGAAYQVDSIDNVVASDDTGGLERLLSDEADDFEVSDRRAVIDDLLDHLPERERRIVELRFYHEKSQTEIGEIVGVSQMHVSRLLRRALESMRNRLDQSDGPA